MRLEGLGSRDPAKSYILVVMDHRLNSDVPERRASWTPFPAADVDSLLSLRPAVGAEAS